MLAQAIRRAEEERDGQIRVAIDSALPLASLLCGHTVRDRAVEMFSQLRVWDTSRNNGVLLYLCLATRQVEIVADRGVDARVGAEGWREVCRDMETVLRTGDMVGGVLTGIEAVSRLLARHYGLPALSNTLEDSPHLG